MAPNSNFFQHFTEIVPSSYAFTVTDVLIVLSLSFVLSLIIAKVYALTHRGVSYSNSFVHTLVILTILVSCVMLIVGSNIARAFTLLGALSIVRFRTAMKEPRDLGYVFWAMTVGMAVGTRFYPVAIIMCIFISLVEFFLTWSQFGSRNKKQSLLRLVLPADLDFGEAVGPLMKKYMDSFSLVNIKPISATNNELNYIISLKKNTKENDVVNALKLIDRCETIDITHSESTIEI